MVEITWSDTAKDNLQDIFDFISKDSIYYAEKEIDNIDARLKVLYSFPLSGKIVPEYHNDSIRELIQGNYRIMYKIYSEKAITILTVHHSSRLLQ
jgi:addiction module RelE/StbE family toxin